MMITPSEFESVYREHYSLVRFALIRFGLKGAHIDRVLQAVFMQLHQRIRLGTLATTDTAAYLIVTARGLSSVHKTPDNAPKRGWTGRFGRYA